MLSRRQLLLMTGEAALAFAFSGCASSPLLRKDVFAEFGDARHPYLGLATSLHEEHSYEARIEGNIPPEVRGTLYRNGPGLFDRGGKRKRNLLDGDGMVQSFRFHDNGVHYRNRFVATEKYVDEEKAGRFIYPSWSTQAPGGMWNNIPGGSDLKPQAGITVFPWQGRLYAFDECAYPYELDPDTLETTGLSYLGLPKDLTIYAAHAKFDPRTGEWLHFGIAYGPKPKLHITVFNPDGRLKVHRTVPMPRNIYMHDWVVSGRYLIFIIHPVEIAVWGFLLGQRSLAESLRWKPDQGNLIMVVERDGTTPPVMLVGYPGKARRYLIDPAVRTLREETIFSDNFEWPRVHEMHRGYGYRYGYMVKTRPQEFFWTYVCRIDMKTGRTENHDFGAGSYCSEPVFVPLPNYDYRPDGPEPGYLMTEVYDSSTRKSYLALLRADHVAEGPTVIVHLNHHVPFSYHGWWSARG